MPPEQQLRLFGRQRSVHAILGGGKVADILLWKNKTAAASLLIGMTVIWSLFEVMEYRLVTLFCHISMATLLVAFIWFRIQIYFDYRFFLKETIVLMELIDLAYGKDLVIEINPILIFLSIVCLYILSVIGNHFNFLNLVYFGLLCSETLPFLYDRYEDYVDSFADKGIHALKKLFTKVPEVKKND
ncbi:reticulon-like protein B9 [Pistacia vera]|uniref:reticulon-like protein B9 n=1 Tax=Pistacia vera TaxID=55513 RepID=UPI00126383EB|nr:reticulon-like protein B9 [Pistacia vera]